MLRVVVTALTVAMSLVLWAGPASAQVLTPGASIFTFEGQGESTPIGNVYPGSGLSLSASLRSIECLDTARVFAVVDAKTPTHVLRVPCSPILTASFANPQAFVALWIRSEQPFLNEIVVNGRDAAGTIVITVRLPPDAAWRPVTLQQLGPQLALRSITVETIGAIQVDDIAVAQQGPQPDMRIVSGPPAFTRDTAATFELQGNWVGTRFQCSLDSVPFADCSPVDALTGRTTIPLAGLAERTHTFSARAVDWYGNVDPTPVNYSWTVDRTPPDTRIDSGPAPRITQAVTQLAFSSPQQADAASYQCRLDGAASVSVCSSPYTTGSLGLGLHTFEVQAVDQAGNVDATPAVRQWTVAPDADRDSVEDALDNCPASANADQRDSDQDGLGDACDPPPLERDGDGDTVPDARDNCPDRPNADQADADRDGLGDVCDVPADRDFDTVADGVDNCPDRWNADQLDGDRDGIGDVCDVPPTADADGDGVPDAGDNCPRTANANQADADRDALGDACDVLPPGTEAPIAGVRAQVQAVGGEVLVQLPNSATFVSLKGVASVPVGSTIDTRGGRIAITAAARRGSGKGIATSRASVAAAIFKILQQRRSQSRAVATQFAVKTPPGLARACRPGAVRPLKGIVRTLSGSGSGLLVTRGAASDTSVRSATWLLQDRCDGTLTEVGRGRASVRDRRLRRTIPVAAGQSYLAKARLFAARRTRGS